MMPDVLRRTIYSFFILRRISAFRVICVHDRLTRFTGCAEKNCMSDRRVIMLIIKVF